MKAWNLIGIIFLMQSWKWRCKFVHSWDHV